MDICGLIYTPRRRLGRSNVERWMGVHMCGGGVCFYLGWGDGW
jgi:hypothetical protein